MSSINFAGNMAPKDCTPTANKKHLLSIYKLYYK